MLRYLWKAKKSYIFVNIGISVLNSIMNVLQIILLKVFLDSLLTNRDIWYIIFIIIIYAISMKLHELFYNLVYQFELPKASYALNEHLTNDIIDKASTIDLSCFDNTDFYNKYTLALSETTARSFESLNCISSLVYSIISIVGLFSVIITMDPVVFLLALLLFASSSLFVNKQNKLIYERDVLLTPLNRHINYCKEVFFSREKAKELRLLPGISQYLKSSFSRSANEAQNLYANKTKKIYKYSFVKTICTCFAEIIIPLSYLSLKCLSGAITVGSVTSLWESIKGVANTLSGLTYVFESMQKTSLYIDNLKYILEYEPNIKNPKIVYPIPSRIDIIQFHNVSFRYSNNSEYVLKDIDVIIKSGESIALVGHNGAGKTTLIKLLLRLYEPTTGQITLNGININNFDINEYRKLFATIFQDYSLFAVPISVNVLGDVINDKEQEKRVIRAMKKTGIYDRIATESKGIYAHYSREFDDDGVYLSGGEIQKLALSRLFANTAPFVVLDEPTSALDIESEHEFFENFIRDTHAKTSIMISHRLSTTKNANKIYYLENGRIVEQGSHNDLMMFAGRYKYIFNLQADKYRGDVATKKMKECDYE